MNILFSAQQRIFPPHRRIAFSAWLALLFFAPLPAWAGEETGAGPFLASGQETVSLTGAVLRAMGSLIIVLALIFLLLYLFRKSGLARHAVRQGGLIRVLDLRSLAPRRQVAVLEVAGEFIVVGLAEQQITLLHTLKENDLLRAHAEAGRKENAAALPPSFAALLHRAGLRRHEASGNQEGGPHAS